MAEGKSLTAREAVRDVLASEHADVLRESVAVMVREIMELEVTQLAGAELGERAPARRAAQRNGYRDRRWDTRVGEIELAIPRLRTGSYLPSFLEPRRRAEQALVAVVQEAYVNGVSRARWIGWWSRWDCGACRRIRCRGCALAWMSRFRRSGDGRLSVCVAGREDRTGQRAGRGRAKRRWWSPMRCTNPVCGR